MKKALRGMLGMLITALIVVPAVPMMGAAEGTANEETISVVYDAEYDRGPDGNYAIGVMVDANKPFLDTQDFKEGKSSLSMVAPTELGGECVIWLSSGQFQNGAVDLTKAKTPALAFWLYYDSTGPDGNSGGTIEVFVGSSQQQGQFSAELCSLYYLYDDHLQNGWNRIVLPIHLSDPTGRNEEPPELYYGDLGYNLVFKQMDFSKIDMLRIANRANGPLTVKYDDIRFVDLGDAPTTEPPATEPTTEPTTKPTTKPTTADTTAPAGTDKTDAASKAEEKEDGLPVGAIVGIVIAAVAVIAIAAAAIYFLKVRKPQDPNGPGPDASDKPDEGAGQDTTDDTNKPEQS